jgi:hypothetical protein
MRLFFGNKEIPYNGIVSFADIRYPPTVEITESESGNVITTIILFNATTKYIHWFN